MSRSYKIKLLIFLLVITYTLSGQRTIREYPEWFLKPSKFDNIAIGYSSIDSTTIINAANRYTAHKDCIVKGALYYYLTSEAEYSQRSSDYYYYFSKKLAKKNRAKLISLDSIVLNTLNQDYIELFAFDSSAVDSTKFINVKYLNSPEWMNKSFFEKNGYYYSVGLFKSTGRDNDAWYASEERAIFNLLRNVAIEIYNVNTLYESENKTILDDITAYKLNYRLQNIEVVERFPHQKQKQFYTLIRVPKNGVTVKLSDDL